MPDPAPRPARDTDTGEPDARLAAALRAWAEQPAPRTRAEVLAALAGARVFLALSARALGSEVSPATGLRQESTAEMALLTLVRPDGGRVLPAFSDGHEVQRWRGEARPVPVPGPRACATARDDGAEGLVLDPTAAAFAVDAVELAALAEGQVPVPGAALSHRRTTARLLPPAEAVDPALVQAAAAALRDEPVTAARFLTGPAGLVLGVVPAASLPPHQVAALAERVGARLRPVLPADGLDLAAVSPEGPGQAVPLPGRAAGRRRWRRLSARGR